MASNARKCCCGETVPCLETDEAKKCAYCRDTPQYWQLDWSSMTFDNAFTGGNCLNLGDGTSIDFNLVEWCHEGSVSLGNTGGCRWIYVSSIAADGWLYDAPDCGGVVTRHYSELVIELVKNSATQFRLEFYIRPAGDDTKRLVFYSASFTVGADNCWSTISQVGLGSSGLIGTKDVSGGIERIYIGGDGNFVLWPCRCDMPGRDPLHCDGSLDPPHSYYPSSVLISDTLTRCPAVSDLGDGYECDDLARGYPDTYDGTLAFQGADLTISSVMGPPEWDTPLTDPSDFVNWPDGEGGVWANIYLSFFDPALFGAGARPYPTRWWLVIRCRSPGGGYTYLWIGEKATGHLPTGLYRRVGGCMSAAWLHVM